MGYPVTPRTLGEHLKRRRLVLGLTQRRVAEQLGVNAWTVINWEQDRNPPPTAFLPKIYDFFGYCIWRPSRNLGDRLRLRRELAGLSRRECAKHLGLDEATLARVERGSASRSSRRVLGKISGFLG